MFTDFQDYCGIGNLMPKLNRTLLEKIKETLPYIKSTLQLQVWQKEEGYLNFRKVNDLYRSQAYSVFLLNLVNTFAGNLSSALRGGSSGVKIKDKLFGGAKISLIFEKSFTNACSARKSSIRQKTPRFTGPSKTPRACSRPSFSTTRPSRCSPKSKSWSSGRRPWTVFR